MKPKPMVLVQIKERVKMRMLKEIKEKIKAEFYKKAGRYRSVDPCGPKGPGEIAIGPVFEVSNAGTPTGNPDYR